MKRERRSLLTELLSADCRKKAAEIFNLMEPFAGYAFKSALHLLRHAGLPNRISKRPIIRGVYVFLLACYTGKKWTKWQRAWMMCADEAAGFAARREPV